jgi:hypothetical protein
VLLGDQVIELVRGASSEVTLISAFIKCDALSRLVSAVPAGVALRCFTRWRPEELACGVADLGVWPVLKQHGAALALRADLHAKAYIADGRCLVGSANLTGAGFGWTEPHNLEVLVEVRADQSDIVGLRRSLDESVNVDDDLHHTMSEAVAALSGYVASQEPRCVVSGGAAWLPVLRSPELLYEAYSGRTALLATASRAAAEQDLRVVPVPAGLGRHAFEAAVAVWLLQLPLIVSVDRFVSTPRRFGEVSQYLAARVKGGNPDATWQTLMRWLRHFWPRRYVLAQPNYTEVFVKRSVLVSAVNGREKSADDTASGVSRDR